MKHFAVIGLGNFGFHAARALYEDGNEVIAIDADKTKVQNIDRFATDAVFMDATEKAMLQTLGLETMDAVIVSTGTKISNSILICLYLQEIGVKRIMAKAIDEDHEKILRRVGATDIIHPERDMALRISQNLSHPNVLDYLPLSGDFNLVQIEPPGAFIGKSLKGLDLRARYNVHIIGIRETDPDNFVLVPSAEFIIKETDTLLLLGRTQDIRKIRALK